MFEFDGTDKFNKTLEKLSKRNPVIATAVNRKIKEIINRDKQAVMAYKNLRHDFSNLKRVHITEWLVMTFEVNLEKNFILFERLAPTKEVYKR